MDILRFHPAALRMTALAQALNLHATALVWRESPVGFRVNRQPRLHLPTQAYRCSAYWMQSQVKDRATTPLQRTRPFPARRRQRLPPKAGQADQLLAVGQVLSMLAHGRLTAPPLFEAVAVTNSTAGMRLPGIFGCRAAKATSLESFESGVGSRSRSLRIAGRARRKAAGPSRPRQHRAPTPARAFQNLSPAREATSAN